MTYQIFKLIKNSRFEPDGYDMKTVDNYTLEQGSYPERYNSYSDVEEYIKLNADDFKCTKFAILRVLEIDYNGAIR